MRKLILHTTLFIYAITPGYAQPGELDPLFGIKGIVKTDIGFPFDYRSEGRQVLTGPGGSIYIIFNFPTFVSKRFPDGSVDHAYGINGYSKSTPFKDAYAALQPDGKIVIAGS